MEKVLIPFDGSEQSEDALRFALRNYGDAKPSVLYVIDPVGRGGEKDVKAAWWEMWYEDREKRAKEILERAEEISDEEGREITTEYTTGNPSDTIIKYVENEGFDRIVMGRQGERGLKRVLLGSVAENVARHVDVPVTLVGETNE